MVDSEENYKFDLGVKGSIANFFIIAAGFLSGNKFTSSVYNITNISNIHLWMFNNQDVGGSSGIWYTQWPHWEMNFALKLEPCPNCSHPDCGSKTCYFGTCGISGECQCITGYSGENCTTSMFIDSFSEN